MFINSGNGSDYNGFIKVISGNEEAHRNPTGCDLLYPVSTVAYFCQVGASTPTYQLTWVDARRIKKRLPMRTASFL
jgi:hypothetical protein